MIKTVKIQGDGYLLNGKLSVPKADGNRHYEAIKKWISEGNTPEPEFTQAELDANEKEEKIVKAKADIDAVLGDMTTGESMYYMLQYGQAKATPPSDAADDANAIPTPTGEDIITWGDRIANELDDKIRSLRNL